MSELSPEDTSFLIKIGQVQPEVKKPATKKDEE